MTTIAYDKESNIIAYDSRETDGNTICSDSVDKKIVTEKGVWFCAGCSADIDYLIENYIEWGECDAKLDVNAYLVDETGVHQVCINNGIFKKFKISDNEAIGSGYHFAMSAMDYGKSARDAVEYAKTRDVRTGGKVNIFDVDEYLGGLK